MADGSDLKINERSNVERPKLRVTEIGNKNWEKWFMSKGKYENWWNCEKCGISKDQQFQNLYFWSQILVFPVEKILEIF